jgi:hypothetical protein
LGDGRFVAAGQYPALHVPLPRWHGQAVLLGTSLVGVLLLLPWQGLLLQQRRRRLLWAQSGRNAGKTERAFLLPADEYQAIQQGNGWFGSVPGGREESWNQPQLLPEDPGKGREANAPAAGDQAALPA